MRHLFFGSELKPSAQRLTHFPRLIIIDIHAADSQDAENLAPQQGLQTVL